MASHEQQGEEKRQKKCAKQHAKALVQETAEMERRFFGNTEEAEDGKSSSEEGGDEQGDYGGDQEGFDR